MVTNAKHILEAAAATLDQRGKQYDAEGGERSMERAVVAFAAVTGVEMTVTQGWQFMQILKMVRSNQGGGYHEDSYLDGVAYAALAAEQAALDNMPTPADDVAVMGDIFITQRSDSMWYAWIPGSMVPGVTAKTKADAVAAMRARVNDEYQT